MKTFAQNVRSSLITLLAMSSIVALPVALTACGSDNTPSGDNGANTITQYSADLSAEITMGPKGTFDLGENLLTSTYIAKTDGKYSLTLVFKSAELNVDGITGTVFVDNAPLEPSTDNNGIVDGTFGAYNANGVLVTDGVGYTYTSGENYIELRSGNVYYVQSVEMPIDSVRETYELALYINSTMMGAQFSKDGHKATLTLDLDSAKTVNAISGLGVATLGNAEAGDDEGEDEDDEVAFTKYTATLDGIVTMGANQVNFTENLIDAVYVEEKNDKYNVTIAFKLGDVNMPYNNVMTGAVNDVPSTGYNGNEITPIFGYYVDETLVTDGISLTYSVGEDYVFTQSTSFYYVKTMTFTVDELENEYTLSMYLTAFNITAASGQQFPYTSTNGTVCNAELAIDLNSGETVEDVNNIVGVATRGEAPAPTAPETDKYIKYGAKLDGIISMGNNNVNFTEDLIDAVYIKKIEVVNANRNSYKYEITVTFKIGSVNMPFNNVMSGAVNDVPSTGYKGDTITPVFGYYKGETLVTEGVILTYSSGDDYVTAKDSSFYYVKSMTFTADTLDYSYNLSLYLTAFGADAASGQQFPYTASNGTVCNAVLAIDLTEAQNIEDINAVLGVETRGEVPEE